VRGDLKFPCGHPRTAENTVISNKARGYGRCLACQRARERAHYERHSERVLTKAAEYRRKNRLAILMYKQLRYYEEKEGT
jgi:hypothetical protein